MTLLHLMNDTSQSISGGEIKKGDESVSFVSAYQGPLPHPDTLKGFEDIIPGAANRILKMAENEQEFRHKHQKSLNTSSVIFVSLGVLFAFLTVIVISFLIYYSVKAKANEVAIALSAIMATSAGIFIWFNFGRKKTDD